MVPLDALIVDQTHPHCREKESAVAFFPARGGCAATAPRRPLRSITPMSRPHTPITVPIGGHWGRVFFCNSSVKMRSHLLRVASAR